MSHLCVFHSSNTRQPVRLLNHHEDMVRELAGVGVVFERRELAMPVTAQTGVGEVQAAYRAEIDRLCQTGGYTAVDVVQLDDSRPQLELDAERAALLAERTGAAQAWLLVAGRGLFQLRIDEHLYALMGEKGDLLLLPAGIRYWVDAGEHPRLTAIRLLTDADDRSGGESGDAPAALYPSFDDY